MMQNRVSETDKIHEDKLCKSRPPPVFTFNKTFFLDAMVAVVD
jgi:hypothetical protein